MADARDVTPRSALIPAGVAGAVIGIFQLLITWFILGNEDVLLRQIPLTVAAIATAEAFGIVHMVSDPSRVTLGLRVTLSAALLSLLTFCIVAAVATSRGKTPIGDPPALTEWIVTIITVLVAFIAAGFARKLSV